MQYNWRKIIDVIAAREQVVQRAASKPKQLDIVFQWVLHVINDFVSDKLFDWFSFQQALSKYILALIRFRFQF